MCKTFSSIGKLFSYEEEMVYSGTVEILSEYGQCFEI